MALEIGPRYNNKKRILVNQSKEFPVCFRGLKSGLQIQKKYKGVQTNKITSRSITVYRPK